MPSAEMFEESDRLNFLELTSDSSIRSAAYPEEPLQRKVMQNGYEYKPVDHDKLH